MFSKKIKLCAVTLFFIIAMCPAKGFPEEDPYRKIRERMVETQLRGRDITSPEVLKAMNKVPRHLFVGPSLQRKAYGDFPLPIEQGQTISQPYIVALMTQYLHIKPGEKVLEVGTGSGYQSAVLAELTDNVYTIEIVKELAEHASATLQKLGYKEVRVKHGDGYRGWKEYAPFNAVIITCAVDHIPKPLTDQLADGGRLILPLGSTGTFQNLILVKKEGGKLVTTNLAGVLFVPMTGDGVNRREQGDR